MKTKATHAGKQPLSPPVSSSGSEKRILTTRQLFRTARQRKAIIEAHLVLNGGLGATHWFSYLGKGVYLTEGIDGEEYQTTSREFRNTYAWIGSGGRCGTWTPHEARGVTEVWYPGDQI